MIRALELTDIEIVNNLIEKANASYNKFEFHQVYHSVHNFCVVDMSNFYLDVLKDRLYTEKSDSKQRRAAQTTMYIILDSMTRMLAPILAFTSDEIWQFMPHKNGDDCENVVFNSMPQKTDIDEKSEFISRWDKIHELRDTVKKSIEEAVKSKVIRSSLEAKVTLSCSGETLEFVNSVKDELAAAFIVSQVIIVSSDREELSVEVLHADGEKCSRCWSFSHTVGKNEKYPDACERCSHVLDSLDL